MMNRIIYLCTLIAIITACSKDEDIFIAGPDTDLNEAPVTYYPSLDYAFTEDADILLQHSASSYQTTVESSCEWTCVSDCDWIIVEKSEDGETITISAEENNGKSSRSGHIYFYKEERLLSSSSIAQASSSHANCYIISEAGNYAISAVKGNTAESLDAIQSAEVIWETYGTDEKPEKGSLIKSVTYMNGTIGFSTSKEFREGNALIAAIGDKGNILWSWHIWLTDQPEGHVYYNNAGTMMDRNLGATSATPGDVGALGLMYQWGRKDPFLGASDIEFNSSIAESTIKWPSSVNNSTGTVEFTISHPTTFVANFNNHNDEDLWTTSAYAKSIYDPCPAGWRIPDGNTWAKAVGSSNTTACTYDTLNEGVNFSKIFGSAEIIWYPAAGIRASHDVDDSWVTGELLLVGGYGDWWSASHDGKAFANILHYYRYDKTFEPLDDTSYGYANSVRCIKEN